MFGSASKSKALEQLDMIVPISSFTVSSDFSRLQFSVAPAEMPGRSIIFWRLIALLMATHVRANPPPASKAASY